MCILVVYKYIHNSVQLKEKQETGGILHHNIMVYLGENYFTPNQVGHPLSLKINYLVSKWKKSRCNILYLYSLIRLTQTLDV